MEILCVWKLVISSTLLLQFGVRYTHGNGDACGDAADFNLGNLVIDNNCRSISGAMFIGSIPWAIFQSGGDLLNDKCDIMSSGTVIATFTGDGQNIPAYRTPGDTTLTYECILTQDRTGDPVTLTAVQQSVSCFNPVTEGELPLVFSSPGGGAGPHGASFCSWVLYPDSGRASFEVVFQPIQLPSAYAFLHVKTNEGGVASWTSIDGSVMENTATVTTYDVTLLEVQYYVSATASEFFFGTIFHATIPSSCGETVVIKLNDTDITSLNATTGDEFYISPSPVEDLNTLNPKCRSTFEDAVFQFNITECPLLSDNSNPDVISNTYTIWNQKSMNLTLAVQRYIRYSLNFTCELNATAQLTSVNIQPNIQEIGVAGDVVGGDFDISFNLYRNESFLVALEPNAAVTVPDCVYAKVELENIPDNLNYFIMELDTCFATRTAAPESEPSYPIVFNSCVFGPDDTRQLIRNAQPNYAAFKVKSFVWTNFTDAEQEIFFHCDVTVCQNSTGECVAPNCRRTRRSIDPEQLRRLSFGPVKVFQKDNDFCSKDNGMCSDKCEMLQNHVKCSCYSGRRLTDDGKTCKDEVYASETRLSNNMVLVIYGFIIGFVIFICGYIWSTIGRKKENVFNVL